MRKLYAIVRCGVIGILSLMSVCVYAQNADSQSPYYYAGPDPLPPAPVVSADSSSLRPENPDAVYMAADLFLARPAMIVTGILGTGVYILSLPFSFLGGNMDQARQQLVTQPFQAAFQRCLGCDGTSDTGEFLNTN